MAAHAVLVAGPGLGHVNGCMLLAKALLSAGFSHITMVCFSRSYTTLSSKGHIKNLSHPSVRVEVVPDGLPLDTTSNSQLFATTPTMHDNLLHLLNKLTNEHLPVTCLISDMIMAWTQHVADHFGIPRVEYWTAAATSYLCIISLPQLRSRGLACSHQGPPPMGWKTKTKVFLDYIPGLQEFPLEEVPWELRYAESNKGPLVENLVIASKHAKDAACVLVHSMYDLEREAFNGLEQVGIKAFAIGPLLHQYEDASSHQSFNQDITLTWLDSHASASVLYVAFGRNAQLSEEELVEIALGLEDSGKPFLWVVRSDATLEGRDFQDVLPFDFFTHTAKQGLIIPWAPQRTVLSHHAVGGFLSHCGWNSTLESLWMGVPILACPRAAEQPINCRLIVKEWGAGIELQTNQEGNFTRHDVNVGVQDLLDGMIGELARTKARQLSKRLRDAPFEGGHSHSSLLEFASKMINQLI